MTTLSNTLRWFTVSFHKGEVESDIADAYKAILLGLETVAVPRRNAKGEPYFIYVNPVEALREFNAVYPIIKRRHPEDYEGEMK